MGINLLTKRLSINYTQLYNYTIIQLYNYSIVQSIILRALYNAVEKIKLDIANFYLEQAKTTIKQHSIEYERNKFEQFLQKHPSGTIRIFQIARH